MGRFIEANGLYINTDSIIDYRRTRDKVLHIDLTDGTTENVTADQGADFVMRQLSGQYSIIQILPVAQPLYAVYEDEQPNTYFATPIYYMALCADGEIRGVDCSDGWFDLVAFGRCDNCRGLYHRNQLGKFPSIEIEGEEDNHNA